jgi:hypothetical protein
MSDAQEPFAKVYGKRLAIGKHQRLGAPLHDDGYFRYIANEEFAPAISRLEKDIAGLPATELSVDSRWVKTWVREYRQNGG